ncbi:hypothetical protein TU78_15220 [Pseudomonas taetrolens]|uniref:BioF2-like acetyltransferase domain-containing protein n=1 Tax=Pseudomonas taetrolens TaxID=47884 RepID=A0A0J6GGE6_PSETA|nr:hypothetical protein [Pseudomonas taetrolens]KMM83821.1 hypothetical protein TU78_15220 [Pseudomonas taetrolens]
MDAVAHSFKKGRGSDLTSAVSCLAAYVDRHEWDGLINDENFYNSYDWLASLEHAQGPADILKVYGASGLLAGCPLWTGDAGTTLFTPQALFPNMSEQWGNKYLWGGARRSTHNELVCTQGASRQEALRQVFYSGCTYASEHNFSGFLIPYMPLRRALEIVDCTPEAHVLLHAAEAVMPVPAGGLTEMLDSWRSHDRVRSKAEIAAFEKYENKVRWLPLTSDLDDRVATLITNNRNKYGSAQDKQWMIENLRGQRKSGVIHSAIAVLAERGDQVSAVTVFYKFGESLHARYFGSDYTLADNDYRYFVLTYYLSLDYAAFHGLKKCCLSTSALEAKAKRGSLIEPLAAVVISGEDTFNRDAVRQHNYRFAQDYKTRFKSSLSADWRLLTHL